MHEKHGWQLSAEEIGGAEFFGSFFIGEFFRVLSFRGCVDEGAAEDEGMWPDGQGVVFDFAHGKDQCEPCAAGGTADADFSWIDSQKLGVFMKPSDGGDSVFEGFDGAG